MKLRDVRNLNRQIATFPRRTKENVATEKSLDFAFVKFYHICKACMIWLKNLVLFDVFETSDGKVCLTLNYITVKVWEI